MSGITSLGTGSGLPLGDLLTDLVNAERSRTTFRLDQKEVEAQTRISSYGALRNALSQFKSSLAGLKNADSFRLRLGTSSSPESFSVSVESTALVAKYSLKVETVATSHKLVSDKAVDAGSNPVNSSTDIGGGTLQITVGGETMSLVVAEDKSSLNEIAAAINAASDNPGVTATVLKVGTNGSEAKLVLTANGVGTGNSISVSVTQDNDGDLLDGTGLSQLENFTQEGTLTNAEILLDGQSIVNTTGNTFEDAIDGVKITIKKETEAAETLEVKRNTGSVVANVSGFVQAFNALKDVIDQLTTVGEDRSTSGVLLGDSTIRNVENQVRRILFDRNADLPTLSELGVSFNDKGKLTINNTKLNNTLNSRLEDVVAFFSDSDNGLASRLDKTLNSYLRSGGILQARTDGLQADIDRINESREQLERRIQALESSLLSKFSALDSLLGQLNSTGSFLQSQLASIATISQRRPSGANKN